MTRIQVHISKGLSRRWLNHYLMPGGELEIDGVTWDGLMLLFTGDSLEETYERAERFYWRAHDAQLENVCARLRHRFGHNGHGWPSVQPPLCHICKDKGDATTAERMCNELNRPVCARHARGCDEDQHGHRPLTDR